MLSETSEVTEPGFDFTSEELEKFKIWPRGVIPFYIDKDSFDVNLFKTIRSMLEEMNTVTGVKFVELFEPPKNNEERWVFFINRKGALACEDYTTNFFTTRGVQRVVLGYDCLSNTNLLGDMILALVGVPPQHNAPDRDDYIKVKTENIMPDKIQSFNILKNNEWLFHDIKYDMLSGGHYHFHKFSKNGAATIIPKKVNKVAIGEGDGLSYHDVWKIRMLYNFISRKRLTNSSDCSKLFKPGPKFNMYSHKNEDPVQPRKKPNKYLGLPDNGDDNNNNNNDQTEVENQNENDSSEEENHDTSQENNPEKPEVKNQNENESSEQEKHNTNQENNPEKPEVQEQTESESSEQEKHDTNKGNNLSVGSFIRPGGKKPTKITKPIPEMDDYDTDK